MAGCLKRQVSLRYNGHSRSPRLVLVTRGLALNGNTFVAYRINNLPAKVWCTATWPQADTASTGVQRPPFTAPYYFELASVSTRGFLSP